MMRARLEYKINDKGYIFIKCFEDITFYDYQNFATWLLGLESYDDKPDLTVAISLHKFDDRLSYYGILDNDSDGDKVIGVFNGDRFSIYLPDCFMITRILRTNIMIFNCRCKRI